jgi:hypothetical protein
MLLYYGEQLLISGQTFKLKEHPLSGVRRYLFLIFADKLQICGPSPQPAP